MLPNIRNSEDTDILNQSVLNKSRKDKFLLVLTLPPCLKDINKQNQDSRSNNNIIVETLQYSIWGTIVPEIVVPKTTVSYGGQTLNISSHTRPSYDDVVVNFNIDNRFNNWWVIWKWLNVLNDAKESGYDFDNLSNIPDGEMGILGDYVTNLSIFGLNEYNNRVIEFVYTRALPVSLGRIEYNYQDSGEIVSSFGFSFSQLLPKLL